MDNESDMSRLTLQILTGLVGLATVALASMQLGFGVHGPVYASAELPESPILDSNLRFFGGMGLGLGLILLWIVPSIERQTVLFRAVWICALLGGIGRLISVAAAGSPSNLLVGFTILEVIGAPLFIWWQHRVALTGGGWRRS